jgi:chromosomal replication initiator protein
MIPAGSSYPISIGEVQYSVALAFNLTIAEMLSHTRNHRVTCARYVAMYLSREVVHDALAPASFPRLGRAFARDHSTVISACRVVTLRLRQDLGFALLVNRLALDLRSAAVPAV